MIRYVISKRAYRYTSMPGKNRSGQLAEHIKALAEHLTRILTDLAKTAEAA